METRPDSRGTTVLILGIIGLVLFQPLGIAAWIMGNNLRNDPLLDDGQRQMANIGRILGIIAVVLMILGIIFVGMMVAGVVAMGASGALQPPT